MDLGGWDDEIEHAPKRARQARSKEIPARERYVIRMPRHLAARTLRVGSSCSGALVEAMALKELQCTHHHVFACDILESSRIFVASNFTVQQWLNDVHMAEHSELPEVDLYVAGWCCQPFSSEGRQQGDRDPRSDTVWPILDYVERRQPKMFILENVKNLLSKKHVHVLAAVLERLSSIKDAHGQPTYSCAARVLNSKDFGLPQQRQRLYILGLRKDLCSEVVWPSPMRITPHLAMVYDQNHEVQPITDNYKLGKTATANITRCISDMNSSGVPANSDFVIDIGAGRGTIMYYNKMPTITRSRGQSLGYIFTKFGTRISLPELMRCQGFKPEQLQWKNLPTSAVGAMVGNAMSVNVVKHLLRANLASLGF